MPKRIVVVDDLPYLRDVQALVLREAGYAATPIGTAREALERLPELRPDLILLDMSMPGMDGRQFLTRLRALPEWRNLPVILSTGRGDTDGLDGDGIDVLAKPFTDEALLTCVRRRLGED
jgi:CheY-like chemotaxis protein